MERGAKKPVFKLKYQKILEKNTEINEVSQLQLYFDSSKSFYPIVLTVYDSALSCKKGDMSVAKNCMKFFEENVVDFGSVSKG